MQQQWVHDDDAPGGDEAVDRMLAGAGRPGRDRAGVELAGGVGAGQDPHRTARRAAVVEVQADRHHPRQQLRRGMGVRDAALARPGAEAGHVATLPDRDGQVLVPGEVPVHRRGLVEEEPAHRERTRTQDGLGDRRQLARPGQPADFRDPPEQVPAAVDLAATVEPAVVDARGVLRVASINSATRSGGRDAVEDRVAVALEAVDPARGRCDSPLSSCVLRTGSRSPAACELREPCTGSPDSPAGFSDKTDPAAGQAELPAEGQASHRPRLTDALARAPADIARGCVIPAGPLVTWKDHAEEETGMGYGIVMVVAAVVSQQRRPASRSSRRRSPRPKAAATPADTELKEARRLLHNGRYAEAEEAFAAVRTAASKQPGRLTPALKAALALGLAECQASQGEYAKAIEIAQGGRGR